MQTTQDQRTYRADASARPVARPTDTAVTAAGLSWMTWQEVPHTARSSCC